MKKNTDDGAKIYTPLTLKLYDWWVLGVSNRLAWGCPTKEHLLPHFLEHVGNNPGYWCWNWVLPYSRT